MSHTRGAQWVSIFGALEQIQECRPPHGVYEWNLIEGKVIVISTFVYNQGSKFSKRQNNVKA